jgi:hypothetical protein
MNTLVPIEHKARGSTGGSGLVALFDEFRSVTILETPATISNEKFANVEMIRSISSLSSTLINPFAVGQAHPIHQRIEKQHPFQKPNSSRIYPYNEFCCSAFNKSACFSVVGPPNYIETKYHRLRLKTVVADRGQQAGNFLLKCSSNFTRCFSTM